jgi:alkane 1-monooxygenase
MRFRDLKYFAAYIIPILVFCGINFGGWWTFAGVGFAFVIVPLLEPLFRASNDNDLEPEKNRKGAIAFFDLLLFLNIPIIYGAIGWFGHRLSTDYYSVTETIGLVLSIGTLIGASGINVAHELGHRSSPFAQLGAKLLLLPALYMHFFVEHNRGHHRHVATPLDPASAERGEMLYMFWIKSVFGSYLSAWKIQMSLLKAKNRNFVSTENEMLAFLLITVAYLFTLFLLFGFKGLLAIAAAGIGGFLLLETINYIEHYGLRRKQADNGKYERVMPKHSWNSNHHFGRIMLYELTRHSDHHYRASKQYQLLDHHHESPQLPFGYPTAMLASLVPPLWFAIMNKRIPKN